MCLSSFLGVRDGDSLVYAEIIALAMKETLLERIDSQERRDGVRL